MSLFGRKKKPDQKEDADSLIMTYELRTSLWTAVTVSYWDRMPTSPYTRYLSDHVELQALATSLWLEYFKASADTLPDSWQDFHRIMREFFFECQPHEAFDFLEFLVHHYPDSAGSGANDDFVNNCNETFELERLPHRFVGRKLVRLDVVGTGSELAEVQKAFAAPRFLREASGHLEKALEAIAGRGQPDCAASVRESVAAAESACRTCAGDPKAAFEEALDEIDGRVRLNPVLKGVFRSLYSHAGGVQDLGEAMLSSGQVGVEEARFLLALSSALINYLAAKVGK